MEIKPTYVSFSQAKLLKDKGFKGRSRYYGGSGELVEVPDIIENDYRHTNNEMQMFRWEAPEQWMVVEWLRINHGIWVSVDMIYEIDQTGFWYSIRQSKDDDMGIDYDEYPTPQEAYSEAFDYILNKLI